MLLPKSSKKETTATTGGKKILTGVWKKREVEFIENEVVVRFKADKADVAGILKKLQAKELKGSETVRKIDRFSTGVLKIKGDVLRLCEELNRHPDIVFAEPNIVDHVALIPNDTEYGAKQWSLPHIGMPDAWDIEQGNTHVMIAIIDSGIPMAGTPPALSHPDLNDTSRIILGHDLVNNTLTPRDEFGHGTHVAGIASAQSNNATGITGMSWNTLIYIVKVFDVNGNGTSQRFHDAVVEAVDYADTHGLRLVMNYSGGGAIAALKEQAVIYARDHNALLVAAAGNDYAGSVIYPAAYSSTYDNVIAVSSVDSSDVIADYSNIGAEINVSAPGSNIYSCMPDYNVTLNTSYGYPKNYAALDGTSMASPHVAGLAGLLLSYDNTLTPDDVRHVIEDHAVDLGLAGWDSSYGFGRIDAHAAIDSLVPVTVCPMKKELQCFFVVESCGMKEFCLYIKEHAGCKIKTETPCKFKLENFPCLMIKEIPCIKTEAFVCIKIEGCLKESMTGCMKETVVQPPWGDIYIRKGDLTGEPLLIKRDLKHVRPLTAVRNITRKKFSR
jgi:hypothetical protein